MKKYLILLFSFAASVIQAQRPDVQEGLEMNDSLYNSLEVSNMLYGDGQSVTKKSYSLRSFCPSVSIEASGGLSWTAAVSKAMSMQIGIMQHQTRTEIEKEFLSPYFLYDLIPKASPASCKFRKDWMAQTQQVLVSIGNVRLSDYIFQSLDCERHPSPQRLRNIRHYQARSFTKLFKSDQTDESASDGLKQFTIKRSIDRNHPVVICLLTDRGFRQLKSDVWAPKVSSEKLMIQAVVITGYDDNRQAFEISNSTGKSWGKDGFAWISYQDLLYVKYGFELILSEIKQISHKSAIHDKPVKERTTSVKRKPVSKKTESKKIVKILPEETNEALSPVNLQGSLSLNTVTGNGNFEPADLYYNTKGYYELLKQYGVNSQFQLVGENASAGSYIYVLSIDPTGKAELHYPYKNKYGLGVTDIFSPIIPDQKSQIVIPQPLISYNETGKQVRKEQVFIKELAGSDWLVTLYSEKRLDSEIEKLLVDISDHNQDFLARFQEVFGRYLISNNDIKPGKEKMEFHTSAVTSGYVVPMIVKIEGN